MAAGDLAAVVVTIVSLVTTALLTVVVLALVRTLRELRGLLDTLHDQTLPLVDDLRCTVDQAGADLQRVEGILDSAARITSTVDSASQLTYRALSPPLIKTVSVMTGLRRAGRRLRGRVEPQPDVVAGESNAVAHPARTPPRRRGRDRRARRTTHSTDRRR
jgi:hypothetical protein